MSHNVTGLRQLRINQRARIISLKAQGELGRRIRDMGLVPGVEITVIGRAPLKDPVALKINDFTLSLRNNEADYIQVEPLDTFSENKVEYSGQAET